MFLKNAWYVAAWGDEVAPGKLFERTIIGESLVMYRKSDGAPVIMDNTCPHRFAPLSQGKLFGDKIECPYHGLHFGPDGHCALNPYGDGKIPARARVNSYPVVERHAILWVWMGDPALANPDEIPDFSCHVNPASPTVKGVIEMHANYELVTDNLMDLTHVTYVHEGVLGSEAVKRGEHEVLQAGTTVYSNRWCPDGDAPPAWDMMFGNYGKPVDHWLYMRWDAPAHMLLDVGIVPTGRPREEGIWMYGTDILTPKDENSTHYFWACSRSYRLDDPAAGEEWVRAIDIAFVNQDKPMIESQARMMKNRTFDDMDPVLLPVDAAAVRCRRLLAELVATNTPPQPTVTLLSELIKDEREKSTAAKRLVPVV